MAEIKDRIKELRKEYGYTQENLAQVLGLNAKSSIANYESGANYPSDDIKLKMCEVFDCSMDYLMGKSEFKTKKEEVKHYSGISMGMEVATHIEKNIEAFSLAGINAEQALELIDIFSIGNSDAKEIKKKLSLFYEQFSENQRKIIEQLVENLLRKMLIKNIDEQKKEQEKTFFLCPIYGKISAGQPNWAEECLDGYLPIDPTLMNINSPDECFFLRVNGQSMNKVIKNGAYALIRKTDFVDDGEIAVVLVNGFDATLKKFSKQGDFIVLEPMSDDPSIKTQIYTKDTSIKVIGKYLGKFEINQ